MKTYPAILQFSVLLAAAVVFGGQAFCQRAGAQAAPASRIDPATGLPVTGGGPAGIDPATGLPIPQRAGAATGNRGTSPALRLNQPPRIDPATGLPLPAPGDRSAPSDTSSLDPLGRARELMNRGRFEEALQYYVSYHIRTRVSATNGPLVSALSDWVELGQRYPKAKQALLDIRENDTREFVEGRGNSKVFWELAEINAALGEKDYTYALFLGLEQSDPPLAQQCYLILEPALVERGEYEVCGRYLGNPQTRFDIVRQSFEMGRGMAQQELERSQERARRRAEQSRASGVPQSYLPTYDNSASLLKVSTDSFVRNVRQLLEILVGNGRQAEAEKLRTNALVTLDDPRLRPAISDVEARVRTAQASLRPPPAPIVIQPQVVESSILFPAELPEPSASVEKWAPKLQPGSKPNLDAILGAAKDYNAGNQYEESLQHHLWYHKHALEYEPESQRGVRLSYALSDWVALGRKYPKAREALQEVRDRDMHEFVEGRGSAALFKDIEAINSYWGLDSTTCRLFKYLNDHQPDLAKRCYPVAEDALAKSGEYALCLTYLGDGQERFKVHRQYWERLAKWEQHVGQVMQQAQQKQDEFRTQNGPKPVAPITPYTPRHSADNLLVNDTRRLIEILVGAGHKADAENICTQALALVDDPRLQAAVSDAEKRTGK